MYAIMPSTHRTNLKATYLECLEQLKQMAANNPERYFEYSIVHVEATFRTVATLSQIDDEGAVLRVVE